MGLVQSFNKAISAPSSTIRMVEEAALPINTPIRTFEDHERRILGVAVFPDRRRMVTGSYDQTLRLWDLKNGNTLKKMEGHCTEVRAVAVTGDGELIASGDMGGELIAWDGDTGECVSQVITAHSNWIYSLDFSPDGAVLASGSWDWTTKLWNTSTWQLQGSPINCRAEVWCIRYSPSGEHLAIATTRNIQIWNPSTSECITNIEAHARFNSASNLSLAWTPDGTRLLSAGNQRNPTIRMWDPSTWKQVGYPWEGHTDSINAIVIDSTGTLVASASDDYHVRLWRLSDRGTIAIFKHSGWVRCLTFSTDGKEIISGGNYNKISKWAIPEDALSYIPAIDTTARNAALINAQKIIDHSPSSFRGYRLKHSALHDAHRYDEAISAFQIMLSKLENAPDTQIRKMRQHYLTPFEAEGVIRTDIYAQLDNTPLRLLNTTTGLLCDRDSQISVFKTSTEHKELLSFTMKHPDLRMERIKEVAENYFRFVMLSHRWEANEPLLHDIQGNTVYKPNPVGGIMKLQSFCKIARDAGYCWAWSDTCCIDKTNNFELQESLNSMFVWYRHSALTIVYLSDVPPSSESGALSQSAWTRRGWTVGEFLAPKVILFYQKNWTRYLGDHSSNHKQSTAIMEELGRATGIDPLALVAFRPGMRGAREKLQWASTRVTTLQEDTAYSLFGIFGIHLPVIYGEKKQNALGRLLQEIVAESGDITALDWVGKSSEFNSCLPADITSYKAPPSTPPCLSEDNMQKSVSVLQRTMSVTSASRLCQILNKLSAPRFAHRRLHLPCIVFHITELRRGSGQGSMYSTYEVKAGGLHDLLIITEDTLFEFTRGSPPQQKLLLVLPWNRDLLDFADDTQSAGGRSVPGSSGKNDPQSRPLRLLGRLGQPFTAFLLAQQRSGEYKRIASDRNIIAQVKNIFSYCSRMVVETLEIL